MDDDPLVAMYAQQAEAAMRAEAERRMADVLDPEEEERLRNLPLVTAAGGAHFVPALLSRLGPVRAALDGHGGGIEVSAWTLDDLGLDLVLDLTGACVSCGAAPGTLQGVRADLEADSEVVRVRFDARLLEGFDDLGRDFVLTHGGVEFVSVEDAS